MNTIAPIIAIYIVATMLYFIIIVAVGSSVSSDAAIAMLKLLPQDLKEQTRMNWFGCIVTSLILLAILPIVWIGRFIYWLFHIERREDEGSE